MTRRKMLNITLVCSLIIASLILLTSAFPVKFFGVSAYDGLFTIMQPSGTAFEANYVGSLQILAKDEIDKHTGKLKCRFVYYLKTGDGKRYKIEDQKNILKKIKPSLKVNIDGTVVGNKIIVNTAKLLSGKHDTTDDASTVDTLGEQKTLVALFNFPDDTEQPITMDHVKDEVINNTDSTNNFFKENSYKKTWLNADFIDWKTLPHDSSDYASEKYDLTDDSIATLDHTVFFPDYERLIFIYDNTDSKSWGASGSVGKWGLNSKDGWFGASIAWVGEGSDISGTISHELGHGFDFGHASSVASSYPYYVPESLLRLDTTSSSGTEYNDYGDDADTMGSSYPYYAHFSTVWKSQAQWLDKSQIKVADTSGEFTLDQVETSSTGVKAVKILIGKDVEGEDFYYWLEYRKNLGSFDMNGAEADKVQIRAKHQYNYGSWNGNAVRFKEQKNIFNATPTKVSELSGSISIAAGENHSLALKSDGTVWAWGDNDYGQLGNGTITANSTPVQVSSLNGIIAISAGGYHSLALKSDGTVWTWGRNWEEQLGDGTNSNSNVPVQVSIINGIIAISGGFAHSIALKSDGTVWTFGRNDYGQLGDGSNTYRNMPVQVNGLSDVIAIDGGNYHSLLALKSDGTLWAWGYNGYGQLGNGTTSNSNVPVQVNNINGIIAISAGGDHSLALKSDSTVWTWGRNSDGQLGNGTTSNSNVPVQVNNIDGIIAISAGDHHSLALKSDNTVWTWGRNWEVQLGDGTNSNNDTPLKVNGLGEVNTIAGGGWHSLVIDSDDTVWEWGKYFLDYGNYYIDIDTDTSFYDPYRGVKVALIEKTGTDAESKAKLKISLSGININPEDVLNFGTVPSNATSTNTVTITNNSGEEIGIDELSISGKDSALFKIATDGCSNKNLASGESCNVTISFSPDSEGDKFGILHMPNNDSLRPKATISLYGYAVQTPVVSTGAASDITANSATLNATVNANGLSTTAWFEYVTIGDYAHTTSLQVVNGSNSTFISSTVSGLLPSTTYYYRIAASNNEGVSYGDEMSFTTSAPTPMPVASPTLPPPCEAETITVSPTSLVLKRKRSGDVTVMVTGADDCAVEGEVVTARINAAGKKCISISPKSVTTDENGEARFTITARKKTGAARVILLAGSRMKYIIVKVRN